ncbi:uncharacterized protein LOC134193359 [Corticium candelabrum]|uniref:uncharacterized protein LOC134193359 n=1 Tax=Corticium candelabrum TaxID=121492 RepID=UPI002E259335|nr:uncharacterized protein LOC134193359 [Corticium candelabrum]
MLRSLRAAFGREHVQHYGSYKTDPPVHDSAVDIGEDDEFGFTVIQSMDASVYNQHPHNVSQEKVESLSYCSSSSAEGMRNVNDVRVTSHVPCRPSSPTSAARQMCRLESRDAADFVKVTDIPVWLGDHLRVAMEAKQVVSYFTTADNLLQLDISRFTYDFTLERQFLASVQ